MDIRLPPAILNRMQQRSVHQGLAVWWQADILKADQTYTAPHYYKRSGQSFEIADEEYMLEQEEGMEFEEKMMSGGMQLA